MADNDKPAPEHDWISGANIGDSVASHDTTNRALICR
jgi:hypothetical protein